MESVSKFCFSPISNITSENIVSFKCEEEELNLYFQSLAAREEKEGLSRNFICQNENKEILGFYSLSAAEVSREDVKYEGQAIYHKVPVLRIGRLARDINYKRQQIGNTLMFHALKKILDVSKEIGITGVIVDAKSQYAIDFYESLGFYKLTGKKLFLPMKVIENLL